MLRGRVVWGASCQGRVVRARVVRGRIDVVSLIHHTFKLQALLVFATKILKNEKKSVNCCKRLSRNRGKTILNFPQVEQKTSFSPFSEKRSKKAETQPTKKSIKMHLTQLNGFFSTKKVLTPFFGHSCPPPFCSFDVFSSTLTILLLKKFACVVVLTVFTCSLKR